MPISTEFVANWNRNETIPVFNYRKLAKFKYHLSILRHDHEPPQGSGTDPSRHHRGRMQRLRPLHSGMP